MANMNRLTLMGNVGKDPEFIAMRNGKELCKFSVASNESWKDKQSGEWETETEWTNVVVYNEFLVNKIKQQVKKGTNIFIEGKKKTRKWDDDQGVTHYITELVISGFEGKLDVLSGGIPKEDNGPQAEREPGSDDEDPFNDDVPW